MSKAKVIAAALKSAKKSTKAANKSTNAAEDAAKSAKVTKVAATTAAALGGAGVVYTGLKHLNGVMNGDNTGSEDNSNTENTDTDGKTEEVIIDGSGREGTYYVGSDGTGRERTYYVGSDGIGETSSQSSVVDTLFKYLPFIIGGIIIIALFALPKKSGNKKKRGTSS